LFDLFLKQKNYEQNLKKDAKNKIEVHYLFIKTNISTRHKQHFEIHSEFRPWDGGQMVNIKSLILYYGLKYGLKYNKTHINTICSFGSI
jgi:hypothetical protein